MPEIAAVGWFTLSLALSRTYSARRWRGVRRVFFELGAIRMAAATSRAHAMKRSAGGLKVRFFSETMSAGNSAVCRFMSSSLRANEPGLSRRTETGNMEINRPLLLKMLRM